MNKCLQLHESFYHEIFILEQNLRNHESFLPRKFGAIQYYKEVILIKPNMLANNIIEGYHHIEGENYNLPHQKLIKFQ